METCNEASSRFRRSPSPRTNSSYGAAPRPFWQPFKFNIHRQAPFVCPALTSTASPPPGQLFRCHQPNPVLVFGFQSITPVELYLKSFRPSAGKNLTGTQRVNVIVLWVEWNVGEQAWIWDMFCSAEHVKAMKASSLDSIGPMDFSKQDQAGEPVRSGPVWCLLLVIESVSWLGHSDNNQIKYNNIIINTKYLLILKVKK